MSKLEELFESAIRISAALERLLRLNRVKQFGLAPTMDIDDVAAYLNCKRSSVLTKYSHLESFPRPVGGGEMGKRWVATEIQTWHLRRA